MKKNKQLALKPDTLYSGDCFDVMQQWDDGCVDLIYLDPPFNSGANYNIIFGKDKKGRELDERAQFTAFGDTWNYTNKADERIAAILDDPRHLAHNAIDGLKLIIPESPMLAYLSYMADRVAEMHRLLKDTGSLYLHCDPTASHYLKIILDDIFGGNNFRNEIVWCYTGPSAAKKNFPAKSDTILRYTKSDEWIFNENDIRVPYKKLTYQHKDAKDTGIGGKLTPEKVAQYKAKGKIPENWWSDISPVGRIKTERLGYPTQKPLALLERIVKASSNEGDLVLDPFCGCGTTAHAAQNLRRKFLGIDISIYALDKICRIRLKDTRNLKIMGLPTTFAAAAEMDPFLFEQWAVTLMQGFMPNNKQTGDGGVDGRAVLHIKPEGEKGWVFAQVKQGKPSADSQRALVSQIIGGKASMGVFITLHKMNETKTKLEAIRDAGSYQFPDTVKKFPRLVYWSIEEYFDGIEPPLPNMMATREEAQRDLLTDEAIQRNLLTE